MQYELMGNSTKHVHVQPSHMHALRAIPADRATGQHPAVPHACARADATPANRAPGQHAGCTRPADKRPGGGYGSWFGRSGPGRLRPRPNRPCSGAGGAVQSRFIIDDDDLFYTDRYDTNIHGFDG